MKIFRLMLILLSTFALSLTGCGDDSDSMPDGGTPDADVDGGDGGPDGGEPFVPPAFGEWVKYEPEGAQCSDGSQYKFFVNFSETSDNVVVFMEGGGACWDYESCISGGARGAANPNGIPDTHATELTNVMGFPIPVDAVYPLLNADPSVSPMADWNKVFVPYCTGDVYSGSKVNTYEDPEGMEEDVVFRHVGHLNVLAMVDMLDDMFAVVPKLFVGGCSAGGAGAINNYYFIRSGITGVERGHLLDDSGPIFPDTEPTSRSRPLHDEVRNVWDADALINSVPEEFRAELQADFGNVSTVLASEFPDDRLAVTYFQLDYNYSLYSYERFHPIGDPGLDEHDPDDRPVIHQLWWDDTALLTTQFDAVDNLAYYLPFYRDTNSSHCVTIPGFEDLPDGLDLIQTFLNDFATLAWAGSEIEAETMNLRDYVDHLLDDAAPLESYREAASEGHYLTCAPSDFDADMCKAAVCERHNDERKMTYNCPM